MRFSGKFSAVVVRRTCFWRSIGYYYGFYGLGRRAFKTRPLSFSARILPVMVGIMLLTIATDSVFPGITGTANGAHLGGLIAGLFLGLIWPKRH